MTELENRKHKQGVVANIPKEDRELLDKMSREELYEYLNTQVRNIWRVDGLYFLGIEKRRDMQEATDVDADCWAYMGKVEAKELKKFLGIEEPDPEQVLWLLRHTSWSLSHAVKSFGTSPNGNVTFAVDECRTQLIRLDKGLDVHPCRQVRERYLRAFTTECNPKVELVTVSCPPDRTEMDVWCRWEFRWKD